MKQLEIMDKQSVINEIDNILLSLRKSGDVSIPKINSFFMQWEDVQNIPSEKIEDIKKILEIEKQYKQRLGEKAYFETQTIKAKLDIYFKALIETEDYFLNMSVNTSGALTWVEFNRRFRSYLLKFTENYVKET